MKIFDELSKPFEIERIHWRIGSTNKKKTVKETGDQNARPTKGIPLAYIDARDVMERLDFVVGPENWQCRYPYEGCCEVGIRMNAGTVRQTKEGDFVDISHWVWKSNGAGKTDIEGEKGQYSDAFKRAAVLWGIGRYLYDLPNTWVDLDNWGKPKEPPKLPTWATPAGWNRIPLNTRKQFHEQAIVCLGNGDKAGLEQLWSEWETHEEKLQLWKMFDSTQRDAMKEFEK